MGQQSERMERIQGKKKAIDYLQSAQKVSKEQTLTLFNSKGEIMPLDTSPGSPRPPTVRQAKSRKSKARLSTSFLSGADATLTKTPSRPSIIRIDVAKNQCTHSMPVSRRPSPMVSRQLSPTHNPSKSHTRKPKSVLRPPRPLPLGDEEFTDDSNRDGVYVTADKRGRTHPFRTIQKTASYKLVNTRTEHSVNSSYSYEASPLSRSMEALEKNRARATVMVMRESRNVETRYSMATGISLLGKERAKCATDYVIRRRKSRGAHDTVKKEGRQRKPGSRAEYLWQWKGKNGDGEL